jgi:hypothetical protein
MRDDAIKYKIANSLWIVCSVLVCSESTTTESEKLVFGTVLIELVALLG